ncbi:MAG TPA: NAD(P)-binding domain-containing protein [Solirubrobacteraceae bacterium]|jgi:predicted dinucleotide-binding enzyme
MKTGIIGAGNIGGAPTRRLSGLGHDMSVANSRGPETPVYGTDGDAHRVRAAPAQADRARPAEFRAEKR